MVDPELYAMISELHTKVDALYEWMKAVEQGLKSAQNQPGMMGAMIRSMTPTDIPSLPEIRNLVPKGV